MDISGFVGRPHNKYLRGEWYLCGILIKQMKKKFHKPL